MKPRTSLQRFLDLGGSVDVEFIQTTRMYAGTEDFDTENVTELSDLLNHDRAYADGSDYTYTHDRYSVYDPDGKLIGEGKTRKEAQDLINMCIEQ